ncbi:protein OSB4 chloroplastic isoform X2 [Prunus yedoensis var. nudiflora]|uniref:Protein OSB4 chloroplastic isoform X2 n=1 Tax=Prunus yedoensis var. nudiflora TaxID=2094558 RepID=A0A314XRC4_PRUYE|nr:protein OSB4 chloroplastic isoform X2 [Prunus yedoensis var. nudiflora]
MKTISLSHAPTPTDCRFPPTIYSKMARSRNKKGPDFKHKETGEALWLSSSPAWVLPKLPPLRTKQAVTIGNTPPA